MILIVTKYILVIILQTSVYTSMSLSDLRGFALFRDYFLGLRLTQDCACTHSVTKHCLLCGMLYTIKAV